MREGGFWEGSGANRDRKAKIEKIGADILLLEINKGYNLGWKCVKMFNWENVK